VREVDGTALTVSTTATRLVYILAASHSGSTLLALLLGTHPEVCTVGELKATSLGDIDTYLCSCTKALRKCEFWAGLAHDLALRDLPFDIARGDTNLGSGQSSYVRRLLRPLHRGPLLEGLRDAALGFSRSWHAHLERTQRLNAQLAAAICGRTGTRVIVDSSKTGIRLKYLLRNSALDVRVLRLVRDGRAVALTYMDPHRYADATDPELRGGGPGRARHCGVPMVSAARQWRRSQEEAAALLRSLDPAQWMTVRYEDMCTDHDATLRHVFAFIGVASSRAPSALTPREHHVIGNGMRLDPMVRPQLDDRWRSTLSAADLAAFDQAAGSTNRSLGYA
jgi:hypothetical protein